MDDKQRAAIAEQCRNLVLALGYYGDHRDAASAVALFAEDGTWLRGGVRYTGHAELSKSYQAGSPTAVLRHLHAGTYVTVTDDDQAEGITYYLAFNEDPGTAGTSPPYPLHTPFSMGEYHDSFVRTSAGWRFASRTTVRVFQRTDSTGH